MYIPFERYSAIEKIGEGGMGTVFKVRDLLENRYAVKKYLRDLSWANRKRFEREAALLQAYRGVENIVQIIDQQVTAPYPYIVMEYCEGGSLATKIGKVDHVEATNILSCMTNALKVIHSKGEIHRDIKPGNIFEAWRNNQWTAKLGDFGIACTPNLGFDMTQTPIGTVEYFAPEILRGEDFTQAADVYSLGKTIRELITSSRDAHINDLVMPFRLSSLLNEMMALEPRNRPNIRQVRQTVKAIIKSRDNLIGSVVSSLSPVHVGLGILAALVFSNVGSSKK